MPLCDVPPEHVPALWPHVQPFIAAVLRRDGSGRFEPLDILAVLLRGEARLWVAWNKETKAADAGIVTEIIQFPRLRECRIWIVGGRPGTFKSWVYEARDTLEAYARAQGCAFVTGAMRKGWIRIGGSGWHATGTTFQKRL